MIWIAIAWLLTVAVGCLVAYALGKYWLGWRRFREHLRSIRWSAYAGFPDLWHWGLALAMWLNMDPGMHFTSAGMMLRLGPFTCGWNADDTN